ncbi:MAG: thioredoxin [Ruthenibacterium sp.]
MSLEITKSNFEAEVLQSTTPVLVDFWAPWCGPCRMLGPVIEQIAEENDAIKVGKINVDEQQALAQQFGVATIPTVIAFKNGKESGRSVGLVPKEKLLALL